MDFFDFFFPEQAQAAHLRKIAHQRRALSSTPQPTLPSSQETTDLRADVKFLTLVVTAILKRLAETETMSLDDVRDLLDEIDGLDGLGDGGLDPGVLRGLLGVLKQTSSDDDNEELPNIEELPRVKTHRRRYRR